MLCVLAGPLEAAGGGKDSSGTSEVDDGVRDLGMQLKREGEKEGCIIRPWAGLFLETCTVTTLPSSSTQVHLHSPSLHLPPLYGGLHSQDIGDNNSVIPLHNTAQTQ